jgi:capsular polysaccharide biosynthesis protein
MAKKKFDYKYLILKYFPFVKHRFVVVGALKSCFSFLRYLPGSSINFGPPRGIYLSAEAYNSSNKIEPITEVLLQGQKGYIRELPSTNSSLVIAKFKSLLKTEIIEKKGFSLTRSRYFSGFGGTIVTSDDKIFFPCSPIKNEFDAHKHQSLYRLKLPKCHKYNRVVLIDTKSSQDNYCHWLRDHLSRFYWLKEMKLDFSKYALISTVGNNPYHTYSYEILKAKGFRFESYHSSNEISHFYSDELVIPPYVTHAFNADNTSFDVNERHFLHSLFLEDKININTYKRIYISRRRSSRSSPNEAELVRKLHEFDVKEIFLEDYNMFEQAAIFSNADTIIGFHGAGLTNLYFSKPGTTVVEIFSPDFIVTDYWGLASSFNYRYYAYCEDKYKRNVPYYIARQSPTIIDVDKFINFCMHENLI